MNEYTKNDEFDPMITYEYALVAEEGAQGSRERYMDIEPLGYTIPRSHLQAAVRMRFHEIWEKLRTEIKANRLIWMRITSECDGNSYAIHCEENPIEAVWKISTATPLYQEWEKTSLRKTYPNFYCSVNEECDDDALVVTDNGDEIEGGGWPFFSPKYMDESDWRSDTSWNFSEQKYNKRSPYWDENAYNERMRMIYGGKPFNPNSVSANIKELENETGEVMSAITEIKTTLNSLRAEQKIQRDKLDTFRQDINFISNNAKFKRSIQ